MTNNGCKQDSFVNNTIQKGLLTSVQGQWMKISSTSDSCLNAIAYFLQHCPHLEIMKVYNVEISETPYFFHSTDSILVNNSTSKVICMMIYHLFGFNINC